MAESHPTLSSCRHVSSRMKIETRLKARANLAERRAVPSLGLPAAPTSTPCTEVLGSAAPPRMGPRELFILTPGLGPGWKSRQGRQRGNESGCYQCQAPKEETGCELLGEECQRRLYLLKGPCGDTETKEQQQQNSKTSGPALLPGTPRNTRNTRNPSARPADSSLSGAPPRSCIHWRSEFLTLYTF